MLNQPALRQQYCHHVLALHERLQGGPRPTRIRAGPGARGPTKERRDKGVPGAPKEGQGPETEAAFGRKRAAAISDVMAASPGKRQRMVESAPPGRGRSGDGGSRRNCIRAGRRAGCQARQGFQGGSFARRRSRRKRGEPSGRKVVQSAAQPRQGRDKDLEPHVRGAGFLLVREQDLEARRKAHLWKFRLTSNP